MRKKLSQEKSLSEAISALRWIANNVTPYGPAQAHAANTLRDIGVPVEWPES